MLLRVSHSYCEMFRCLFQGCASLDRILYCSHQSFEQRRLGYKLCCIYGPEMQALPGLCNLHVPGAVLIVSEVASLMMLSATSTTFRRRRHGGPITGFRWIFHGILRIILFANAILSHEVQLGTSKRPSGSISVRKLSNSVPDLVDRGDVEIVQRKKLPTAR